MSSKKATKGKGITHKTRATGSLDVHFGQKMRARRVMMVPKVSQADVGDALGLTFQQIQKYEKGTNRISAAMLVGMAAGRPILFRRATEQCKERRGD